MSTKDSQHHGQVTTEPAYPSSPEPPPDTGGEYLVSHRRAHWTPDRATVRKVFHTYAKATAYRDKIEAGERRHEANANADTPADACGTHVRNHRCTLPAHHPAPCLMDRDLAVAWWGTKTTHRWAEPERTGQLTLLREAA